MQEDYRLGDDLNDIKIQMDSNGSNAPPKPMTVGTMSTKEEKPQIQTEKREKSYFERFCPCLHY